MRSLHEAGIHQHGVLSNPLTYEIMDATSVGLAQNSIVLGKHSGRHALDHALRELGYELDRDELNAAFARFKEIADLKGRLSGVDLEALVSDEMRVEGGDGFAWTSSRSARIRPRCRRRTWWSPMSTAPTVRARAPATGRSTR